MIYRKESYENGFGCSHRFIWNWAVVDMVITIIIVVVIVIIWFLFVLELRSVVSDWFESDSFGLFIAIECVVK